MAESKKTTQAVGGADYAALMREYEEKLAKKEAELCAVRESLEKTNDRKAQAAARKKQIEDEKKHLEEYVSIKLFRDNDKYRDDVYVAVNGENCMIKRGEWVRVKRKFALLLSECELQDMRAAAFCEEQQNRFSEGGI